MLGRADAGNNLLITNPIFIIAFYGYVKLCSDWGQRVKGSSFTWPTRKTLSSGHVAEADKWHKAEIGEHAAGAGK